MSWYEVHQDFTDDVKDMSNLHFPNSCSRPMRAGQLPEGTYVEWLRLKTMLWTFVSGTYDPSTSLDFICPAWWNATACECGCGDCNQLFQECPIGFMLFRALALLCDARHDPQIRIRELIFNKWGCGLLNLASLRIRFVDILYSGWPYFGVLARIGDQLRIDGISEARAAYHAANVFGSVGDVPESLCSTAGWHEDLDYRDLLQKALENGETVPLEDSMQALAKPACPLQLASAKAASLDWILHATAEADGGVEMLSSKGLVQVEDMAQGVEKYVRDWASIGSGDSCKGRPYFFELIATAWPSWKMLQRVGVRLLSLLALDCPGHEAHHQATGLWIASSTSSSTVTNAVEDVYGMMQERSAYTETETLHFCPACDCATQGEWALEARWIDEYAERMSEALFKKAFCSLSGPATRRAWRIARDPFKSWYQRLNHLQAVQLSATCCRGVGIQPLAQSLPSPTVREKTSSSRREAFVTVLFARGSPLRQVLLHAEAIRTLAFSVRKHSLRQRAFLVVTDSALPDVVDASLRADGISVEIVNAKEWTFPQGGAFGIMNSDNTDEQQSWWHERGITPTAVKLAIWNFTAYDCLVFLDADTLLLDSVDELFEVTTFASGMNTYSQNRGHFLHRFVIGVGINSGVMVVQPSATIAAEMAKQMADGVWSNSKVAEHLGQSDQPWLDSFWLSRSQRFGTARFRNVHFGENAGKRKTFVGCDVDGAVEWGSLPKRKGPSCNSVREAAHMFRRRRRRRRKGGRMIRPSDQSIGHCLLPVEYDFFADYKALKMHVWYEGRERRSLINDERLARLFVHNISDIKYAASQYIHTYDVLGVEGPKILHWPGEMRKPWHRWRPSVRSVFDEMWWSIHKAMCEKSSAPCYMRCNP